MRQMIISTTPISSEPKPSRKTPPIRQCGLNGMRPRRVALAAAVAQFQSSLALQTRAKSSMNAAERAA